MKCLVAAFIDVFIAYIANLFVEERMYRINQRALARAGKLPEKESSRWR